MPATDSYLFRAFVVEQIRWRSLAKRTWYASQRRTPEMPAAEALKLFDFYKMLNLEYHTAYTRIIHLLDGLVHLPQTQRAQGLALIRRARDGASHLGDLKRLLCFFGRHGLLLPTKHLAHGDTPAVGGFLRARKLLQALCRGFYDVHLIVGAE